LVEANCPDEAIRLVADGAYDRLKLMDKAAFIDFSIEIVRRSDTSKGFEVLPRCWVVCCSVGWMVRWQRLVRDYEARIGVSKALLLLFTKWRSRVRPVIRSTLATVRRPGQRISPISRA
jgi:transposase